MHRLIWKLFTIYVVSGLLGVATAADFGASLGRPSSAVDSRSYKTEAMELQQDLIWTGDYNGMVDGAIGPNTIGAIERWQRRRQVAETGELAPEQARELSREGAAKRAAVGWTSFRHPELGYDISYPALLLDKSEPLEYGGRQFFGEMQRLSLEVEIAPPVDGVGFRTLYDSLSASRDGRQIGYARFGDGWLVVSGDTQDERFYTRVVSREGGLAGFTFTWPRTAGEQFEPITVAIANSFSVPNGLMPGGQHRVDPRRAPVPQLSPEPPASTRQLTALPPMPGPPNSNPLDAVGVFGLVSDAVWVVVATSKAGVAIGSDGTSLGSAVAVSRHHLLTNCHTLDGSESVIIFHSANAPRPWPVSVIHVDRAEDRCVLLSSDPLPHFVAVRDLEDVAVGERVYTVGAPSGLDLTLGDGLVSALRTGGASRYIQTTAPISPGSSGGGLFDSHGNLIGITTFLLRDAQSLNFALAASDFWRR